MSAEKRKNKINNKVSFFKKYNFEIILAFVTFFVFINTVRNKYCLDDEMVTEKNRLVAQGIGGIKRIFTTYYTEGTDQKYNYEYRPVAKATFALEYSCFGFHPGISHFINVLLYVLCVLVLFRLLKEIIGQNYNLLIFFCCLLFAVHPLHTEVVASLKNRDEILAFLFGSFATLLCIKTLKSSAPTHTVNELGKKLILLSTAAVAFVLAIYSKKDALVFLLLMPFIFFLFLKRYKEGIILVTLSVLIFLIQKMIKNACLNKLEFERSYNFQENPLYFDHSITDTIGMAVKSFGFYLKMFFLPYPLRFYYGYNQISIPEIISIEFLFPLLFIVFLLFLFIKTIKKQPVLALGITWFAVTISAFVNVITPAVGVVAERFAFIPSAGLCLAAPILVGNLARINWENLNFSEMIKRHTIFHFGFLTVLFALSIYSINRNSKWKDRLTLYENDIGKLNNSAKANEIIASEYYTQAGKTNQRNFADSAIKYYQCALEIYPEYFVVYNNLGSLYYNLLGDSKTPIPYFEKALSLDSSYIPAMQNLATCYMSRGDTIKSIQYITTAVKKDSSNNPNSLIIASILYHTIGNYKISNQYIEQSKSKFPKSDLPHIQHSNFLLSQGDTVSALQQLAYAVDKNTQNKKVYEFLIQEHLKRKEFDKVLEYRNRLNSLATNENR